MTPLPNRAYRALTAQDQDALWHWQHLALWDPPPAPLRPLEVLHSPRVRIFVEEWGRGGDVGVVLRLDGTDAGACWMRPMPADTGLAYVDEHTPQLGIALQPEFRHQGHGGPLMLSALQAAKAAGYRQVSLTVHPENPARRVYERCGFESIGVRSGYHLMRVALQR